MLEAFMANDQAAVFEESGARMCWMRDECERLREDVVLTVLTNSHLASAKVRLVKYDCNVYMLPYVWE